MKKKTIKLHDKEFTIFKTEKQIKKVIKKLADHLNKINLENSVFIPVLNGSFMFTSDLCKELNSSPEIQFIKLKSYEGTNTTGVVKEVIGLNSSLEGRTIVIVEDIIDTGITITDLYYKIKSLNPKEIYVVTLLFKPGKYINGAGVDILYGFSIPDDFVVGYGMDYNNIGRSLKEIYVSNQ